MKDCVDNEIHQGAILKIFHFVGKRNRKHFMYKQVGETFKAGDGTEYRKIHHLESGDKFYLKKLDDKLTDSVVVQCFCKEHIHNNLKISKLHGA